MEKTIKVFCESCKSIQSIINRHTKTPIQSIDITARFYTVHIDIVGPHPPAKIKMDPYNKPFHYILTCINRSMRLIEAQSITEITAHGVAETLVNS